MHTVSDREIKQFYELLELPLNAPHSEVKTAYRSLARKYHPDRATGNAIQQKEFEERLKQINLAYEFLKAYEPGTQTKDLSSKSTSVGFKTTRTPKNRTPKTLVEEAKYFQSIGNLEEAIMALDSAIALQDDYYPAYDLRSEVRLAKGNAYGSQQDARRAKHFRWVYKSEGRELDPSPTSPQETAAQAAAKAAVDNVFKTHPNASPKSKASPPKTPQPRTSQSPSKPTVLQKFVGHVDSISQLLFTDRSLISASHDGSVRIWNLETGELQGCLMVGSAVTSIASSPNSNLFITGDRSGKIKMWNLMDRKLLRSIPLHTGKVTGIHFTLNGKGFATTGEDGIIKVFQLNPASLRHTLQISQFPIFSSGILRDTIFTTTPDSKLNVIVNGKVVRSEELSSPMCKTLAVSRDRDWVGIGDDRGSIHCFDRQGNLLKSVAVFPGGAITAMAFIYCGDRLVVSGESGLVKVWNINDWSVVTEWDSGNLAVTAMAVSSNEKIAIANGTTIQTWRLP